MVWRPEDAHYNPDTGYPETRKEKQRRLSEEAGRSPTRETGRQPATEFQIRTALRKADMEVRRGRPVDSITINGITHTVEEWSKIRNGMLGKETNIWE
jgi:hypothetical protein